MTVMPSYAGSTAYRVVCERLAALRRRALHLEAEIAQVEELLASRRFNDTPAYVSVGAALNGDAVVTLDQECNRSTVQYREGSRT